MRFSIFNLVLVYFFSLLGLATGYSIHSYTTDESSTLEDVTINTPSHKVTLRTEFSLTFRISNQDPDIKLHLEPNNDIFVQAPHIRHLDASGEIRHTETLDGTQHRVFKGAVWARFGDQDWQKKGWARVYVLQDGENPIFEGAFTIAGQRYRVEAISDEEDDGIEGRLSHMVVHHDARRGADGVGETCAAGRMPSNLGTSDILMDSIGMITGSTGLDKRQFGGFNPGDLTDSIGSAEGCPTTRRVALVGIATDCSYTAAFNSTESVRRNLINMVNTASEVFESTFNISLGLHNVTISDASCPNGASDSTPWNVECSEGDMDWRLRQFSSWRRSLDDSTNAYWTLMTTCRTGGEVGVSWIGQLCNSRMSTNVVARTSNEWQVFAHESAHTFGAVHDCVDSTCPSSRGQCCPLSTSTCDADAQYLMNPYSSSSHSDFSPCTLGNVCSAIGSGDVRTNCLISNDDVPTITPGECGNGIVEAGEDCDCGDNCDGNSCCNGSTCRFQDRAVCDDASGPCCNDCQYASSDTVCRRSSGACDIEETCPGNSSRCPTDRHVPNGESCGGGNGTDLFCASGECTSRDMQCREQLSSNSTSISSCGDSNSCILSCSDGSSDSGSCISTGQQILDGTPCDGGSCRSGRCRSGNEQDGGGGDGVSSWVDQHRTLVIGLAAGLGGALVLAFLGCVVCCCCRRPKVRPPPAVPQRPMTVPLAYPPPPPYGVAEPRPVLPRYA